VIQYTATSGLAAHAARTKQALDTKHLVFDIGGDTEAQYRQALRECTELILPISISTIETITLNAALATAEDVATEADREINSQVLLCGVDHHDTRELAEAREAAEHPNNNWPLPDTQWHSSKQHVTQPDDDHPGAGVGVQPVRDVLLTTAGGRADGWPFTYTAATTIGGLPPTSGSTVGGDTVTIDVFDVVIHTDFSQAPRSRGIALRRGAR
jgi:hypothetical protein